MTRKISPNKLVEYIEHHPHATLIEIAGHFSSTRGVISYTIKKHGIQYKSKCRKVDQEELIIFLQNNPNASYKEIGAHFGINPGSVYILLRGRGIRHKSQKSGRKLYRDDLQEYVNRHPDTIQQDIAKHFNCSQGAVGRALKRYNIPYAEKHRSRAQEAGLEEQHKYILENAISTRLQNPEHIGSNSATASGAPKRHYIPYGSQTSRAKHQVGPDELRDFVQRHPDATQCQIAKHFRRSCCYICTLLRRHHIPYLKKNPGSRPLAFTRDPEKLKEYVQSHPNATQAQIAVHFGCEPSCVSVALKKYNIAYLRHSKKNRFRL